jgi:hypothetical protein
MRRAAQRALDWRDELPPSRRGMTARGLGMARLIASGGAMQLDDVRAVYEYFPRHEVDKEAQGFRRNEPGYPSKGRQAWDGWGGDTARTWARRILAEYDEPYIARSDARARRREGRT